MLFNSYEFIFAFLPVTAICFYILGIFSTRLALHWLIAASLFFYAWWRPLNVLIIAPSILINFVLARTLQRLGQNEKWRRASSAILLIGIIFNVVFLGYFKYKNFFAGAINDAFGTNFILTQVILPLGISFITFQKIAFLIDVHAGRIESFTLRDYCLFVLFFPQLIAGPIVHYREVMPQFRQATCRFDRENVSIGLTLFFLGLFKKAVLADGIAPLVNLIYEHAASGAGISLFPAWAAAVGFTLQIYFDFSGYSDMALGAARLFGIRLPANFDSPLRATSIVDFWLRWHITLTRFLTAYIYNPLVLSLTRRRLAKGKKAVGGRNWTIGGFVYLLMFPTVLTMFISGLWHGAGYLFVLWGLLHGIYLTINHGWRVMKPKLVGTWVAPMGLSRLAAFLLTFVSVAIAMVLFRSPTMSSAINVLKGLIGLNGIALPATLYAQLSPLSGLLRRVGVVSEGWLSGQDFIMMSIWIASLMFIALLCPNTFQILSKYQPALGIKPNTTKSPVTQIVAWNASLAWAIVTVAIVVIAILHLAGPSEFLYWQF
jgi:alginate O-acetyltransferase complex protein AlgI